MGSRGTVKRWKRGLITVTIIMLGVLGSDIAEYGLDY